MLQVLLPLFVSRVKPGGVRVADWDGRSANGAG